MSAPSASAVWQPKILLCLRKPERALPIQNLLKRMGCHVTVANSFYEAWQASVRELPHLIVAESLLEDGDVGQLYDKVKQDELLKAAAILVLVAKKTKTDLAPVAGRKFSGLLLGFDPQNVAAKVQQWQASSTSSPYFKALTQQQSLSLRAPLVALGYAPGLWILRTPFKLQRQESYTLAADAASSGDIELAHALPLSPNYAAASLRAVPIEPSRLQELPNLCDTGERHQHVLVLHSNPDTAAAMCEAMTAVGIPNVREDSGGDWIKMLTSGVSIGAVYVDQASLSELFLQQCRDHADKLVNMTLITNGTPSERTSFASVVRLSPVFAIDDFMNACRAASLSLESISGNGSSADRYLLPLQGTLIGIDEDGGALEVKEELAIGSALQLALPEKASFWPEDATLEVTACAPIKDAEGPVRWRAAFRLNSSRPKGEVFRKCLADLAFEKISA